MIYRPCLQQVGRVGVVETLQTDQVESIRLINRMMFIDFLLENNNNDVVLVYFVLRICFIFTPHKFKLSRLL